MGRSRMRPRERVGLDGRYLKHPMQTYESSGVLAAIGRGFCSELVASRW
jgi:hypothetical protein